MTESVRREFPALVGGRACLDFVNTVGPRFPAAGSDAYDHLPGYPELTAWAEHVGLLTPGQRRRLVAAAAADPDHAEEVHWRALRLREAIYETYAAIAAGEQPPPNDLRAIQDAYLDALQSATLSLTPADTPTSSGALDWRWPSSGPLEQVLWPIARSAVDLAVSGPPLGRIKRCPGDDGQCGWLFLDTSKNATRRWCSMTTCGSRVKSRRQAARLRAARNTSA